MLMSASELLAQLTERVDRIAEEIRGELEGYVGYALTQSMLNRIAADTRRKVASWEKGHQVTAQDSDWEISLKVNESESSIIVDIRPNEDLDRYIQMLKRRVYNESA
jgi:hypothetical protein